VLLGRQAVLDGEQARTNAERVSERGAGLGAALLGGIHALPQGAKSTVPPSGAARRQPRAGAPARRGPR
jgi:hypothetical protein